MSPICRTIQTHADETSFFSKIKDKTFSNIQLNNYLNKVSKRAFQWMMLFKPDPSKQALEYVFPIKLRIIITLH